MSDKDSNTQQAVMTVADAAVFLRVSESLVRRLIRERRIPFLQIDGRYLFYRPVVEEWLRGMTIVPERRPVGEEAVRIADDILNLRR